MRYVVVTTLGSSKKAGFAESETVALAIIDASLKEGWAVSRVVSEDGLTVDPRELLRLSMDVGVVTLH